MSFTKYIKILSLICFCVISFSWAEVTLLSPPNNCFFFNPSPLFDWQDVSGATEYCLQVDDTITFASPIINVTSSVSQYQYEGFLPETLYYWRVFVQTPAGETSDVWQLHIQTKGPDLIAPPADAVISDRTPTFCWYLLAGASSYQLTVTPSGSVTPVIDITTTDTTYTPTENLSLGDYGWQVVAEDSFDNLSEPSETWFFTISAPPFNGWQELESIPSYPLSKKKKVKDGGSLVGVGNTIYALRGNKSKEFYKYSGNWSLPNELESMPFGVKPDNPTKINKKEVGKGAALCYNGDSLIYATKGNGTKEFWLYNINRDNWSFLGFVPIMKALKGGTSLAYQAGKVYLLAGGQKPVDKNFFAYNPSNGKWDTLENAPLNSGKPYKDGSCLVLLNNYLYALQAGANENYFSRYDFSSQSWSAKKLMPLTHPATPKKKTKIKDGAAMCSDGIVIYAIKGGKINEFWQYTPADTWIGLETIPHRQSPNPKYNKQSVPKTGAALACDNNGYVYLLKGNGTAEFWQYIPNQSINATIRLSNPNIQGGKTNSTNSQIKTLTISPNPFNKQTIISYAVNKEGMIALKLFDINGNLIKILTDKYHQVGNYSLVLENQNCKLAQGVYFLTIQSENEVSNQKLIVK